MQNATERQNLGGERNVRILLNGAMNRHPMNQALRDIHVGNRWKVSLRNGDIRSEDRPCVGPNMSLRRLPIAYWLGLPRHRSRSQGRYRHHRGLSEGL